MDKFYLFGAGINCEGVIKYFGTENIIGIIDSNRELHGKNISGLNIIMEWKIFMMQEKF